MSKKFEFSESDKSLVKEAVKSLERDTSGEMVVYFARSSDDYLEACWKLAVILGGIALVIVGTMSWFWLLPDDTTILHIVLIELGAMLIGFIFPYFIPSLRLEFVPAQVVAHRVMTKARDMFLQEQVFDTIDRTGILIYISELEHLVQVLGDQGINAKIEQKDWDEVVGLVVAGIKSNHIAEGISNAIYRCKDLLLANGFVVRSDDTNELSDDIRIEE